MPCWPEVWDHLKDGSQLVWGLAARFVVPLLLYVGLVVLLLWAPWVRSRKLQVAARVLGAVATLPLLMIVLASFFGFLLATGNPPAVSRMFDFVDGQQAKLSYNAGFLGRDYTEVTLKQPGCCRHVRVFWHRGPTSLDLTKVRWIDSRHLQIRYYARAGDPEFCEPQVRQVSITCLAFATVIR
jgi:hypothetical protein